MGTLVRSRPPAPCLRRELRERLGDRVSEARPSGRWPPRSPSTAPTWAGPGSATRRRPDAALCRGSARRAAHPAARRPGRALTEALLGALRFDAYPDARPRCGAAREGGVRVIVVSNWDVSLPDVLARPAWRRSSTPSSPRPPSALAKPARRSSRTPWPSAGVAAEPPCTSATASTRTSPGARCGDPRRAASTPRRGAGPRRHIAIASLAELDWT